MSERERKFRDPCHNYVPDPASSVRDKVEPHFETLIGNPWRDPDSVHWRPPRVAPVGLGLANESNRDHYWSWAQIDPASDDPGAAPEHWSHFDGWDVRVSFDVLTWNERRFHDWKGYDEIRKTGRWRLFFNEQIVFSGGVGVDPFETARTIERVARKLLAIGPIDWRKPDYRSQIEGRKVYYRDTPAVLRHWMPDQGCVMVEAVAWDFPARAYDIERPDERAYFAGDAREVKIELLSPDLWWWRERDDFDNGPKEGS